MIERTPLVSIIIPTHNRPEKLQRCLQSVLEQTYFRFEVFVIDDASSEAFEYKKDIRVQVIQNAKNFGPGPSRNIGLQQANGEFIAFLDSDDFWETNFLEITVAALIQNPSAAMVYVNGYDVDEYGEILSIRRNKVKQLNAILPEILINNRHWGTGGCLWRKNDIQDIRWIDSRAWEDYAFDIDVALHNNTIVGVDKNLVYYDVSGKDKLSESSSDNLMTQKIISIQNISDALYASKWRRNSVIKKAMHYIFIINYMACTDEKNRLLLSQNFVRWHGVFGKVLWKLVLKLPEPQRLDMLELFSRVYRKQIR